MHLLKLTNDLILVHLFDLLLLHDVSDIIDYTSSLIIVTEAIILLISSDILLLFLVDFLQGLEAEVHQLDCMVHVGLRHSVSEMELGHSLRNSNDCQQSPRRNVHVTDLFLAFSLELSLFDVAGHDVLVQLVWDHWLVSLRLCNKGPHNLRINHVIVLQWSIQLLMNFSDVLGQFSVDVNICLVQEKEDQVKSREKCRR